jgi:putative ABC transport system ATP-binding protein
MTACRPVELAVRVQNVTKTYGTGARALRALRGVNLDIESGGLVMLAGPSGCGKTTLLSIISGMLSPTSGMVEIYGQRWMSLREDARSRLRGSWIGFVFQKYHLVPSLPIDLNVAIPLLAQGIRHRVAQQRAAQVLDRVGLGDRQRSLPGELSSGMQQRVALARALVGRPRLLVCDEPTASLDSEMGQAMMELIHAASRGRDAEGLPRTVLVVTHDYRALRFADVIYQMEDGTARPATADLLLRVWQSSLAGVS